MEFKHQDSNSHQRDGQYRGPHTLLAIFDRHHEAVGEGELTFSPHILLSHSLSQLVVVLHLCLDDGSSSESSNPEETDTTKPGLDASAVGIQLRLIKNDGVLKIEFEGTDGATANWTFDGLALVDGERMVAAAGTQTEVDVKRCLVCGEEKRETVKAKHEETQTDMAATQSFGTQTASSTTSITGMQTADHSRLTLAKPKAVKKKVPLHRRFPLIVDILGPFIDSPAPRMLIEDGLNQMTKYLRNARKILDGKKALRWDVDLLVQELNKRQATEPILIPIEELLKREQNEDGSIKPANKATQIQPGVDKESSADQKLSIENATTTTKPDLKRKASASQLMKEYLHKRATSTHDSPPWPRHIYIECFRNTPIFKGDVGVLHIDVEASNVWFEGWYGKEHMRVQERKQIDVRDPTTRISFQKLHRQGVDDATHDLTIDRLNAQFKTTTLLNVECCAPGWQIWGLDAAHYAYGKPAAKDMIPIASPFVVVDALVHCVDVTSRREAVHDPDTEHKLAQEVREYKAAQKVGHLWGNKTTDWEWTVRELGNREKVRKRLRVVDAEKDLEELNEMEEIRELLGVDALGIC